MVKVPSNISLTPIHLVPSLNFEVIPGCPQCHHPNLGRLALCERCSSPTVPGYCGSADVALLAPWYAKFLLWFGNLLRGAASKCAD